MAEFPFLKYIPLGTFLLLFCLQSLAPRRPLLKTGSSRLIHNLLLFLVNVLVLRVLIPFTVVGAAVWAVDKQWGVFNLIEVPNWITLAISVLLLDFVVYWQHVLSHKVNVLWRLHKVHHADQNMDVTTAVRFHPIELLLSLAYKSAFVIVIGAPVAAVVIFELLLFIGPVFNHSNLAIPKWLDSGLRWVIATPDVHRVHHSTIIEEQNTNYGFFLIWWDKLFSTYTPEPSDGHVDMLIGLKKSSECCERVDQMLLVPFR